jgi:hypothetical protein
MARRVQSPSGKERVGAAQQHIGGKDGRSGRSAEAELGLDRLEKDAKGKVYPIKGDADDQKNGHHYPSVEQPVLQKWRQRYLLLTSWQGIYSPNCGFLNLTV